MSARLRTGIAVALLLVLGACSSTATAPTPGESVGDYAATLWEQRPVVDLSFVVAPDLRSADGHETVVFTPDARTCEMVFRAWPNNPSMSSTGSALAVTDVAVQGTPVTPDVQQAGAPAGAPGTLIDIPLPTCVDAGQQVRADLGFRLRIGVDADERVGTSSATGTAWFGSGYPLLAWARGRGCVRDDAVAMNGETATSEVFDLRTLDVTAPDGMNVAGVGTATGTSPGDRPGTTVHHFTAPAVRDVAVGVGRYTVLDRQVDDVTVHLATPTDGSRADPGTWADRIAEAIRAESTMLTPFPYRDLWVTITPGQSDGTEFPGAIQFGDGRAQNALVAHEVAHQWFYALVGNDQATDPWLDESLATYVENRVADNQATLDGDPAQVMALARQPMSWWAGDGGFRAYSTAVYEQGAAAILEVRQEVGADAFDQALRGYLQANAQAVATPAAFADAFRDLPRAHQVFSGQDTP